MSTWREIMESAEAAKRQMVSNRAAGERAFVELLRQSPRDGMVYFKRGEAYEALGELDLSMTDFQMAESLFPKAEWKSQAADAVSRVRRRRSSPPGQVPNRE